VRNILVVTVLLSLLGCGGGRASSNASPGPGATLVTPTPPAPWGTFVALDYDKPGHPKLTPDAIALIRKTLAVVKLPRCGAYWRRLIQRTEPRNPSRNVPQIIPVATMIAVGKLISRPSVSAYLRYGSSASLVSFYGLAKLNFNVPSAFSETVSVARPPSIGIRVSRE
jgi:hypothetical protein